jgi:prepilin-type N-terminal cleavage/methylation domain-containing protein
MLIRQGANPRTYGPFSLRRWPAGFTLLEIMVGVGVLGMLLISMYQLVGTQLLALQSTRETQVESVAMQGLVRYVQGILAGLPRRRLVTEPDSSYEWITLLPDIVALEFAYFHPSLGLWQEKWEDTNTRPTLVRMKVWRREGEEPFEIVLPVPSARIQ